ncbi:MAG: T9SS type A sorting domain-containing protein [Bacteroides sp.]|nr:T9SS type A sorting domain-containing protein [Bacteroides sp.]MCM1086121.1 T9SS type A sorting domain-containing protein [Bacteroides sp.]
MSKLRFLQHCVAFVAFVFACLSSASGQTEAVFTVVSSAGGSESVLLNGQTFTCDWNLGEVITETFGSYKGFDASKKRLTQGFEQGEGFIEDPLAQDLANEEGTAGRFNVKVFPNPVRQYLNVALPAEAGSGCRLHLRSLQGAVLYARKDAKAGGYSLDMSRLPAGVYVLEVETEVGRQSFKIVKVQ